MARFVARRLLGMVAVLFAISIIVFLIFNVIPNSDPAARIAGKNADPALIARVSADLGLDKDLEIRIGKEDGLFGFRPAADGYRYAYNYNEERGSFHLSTLIINWACGI